MQCNKANQYITLLSEAFERDIIHCIVLPLINY